MHVPNDHDRAGAAPDGGQPTSLVESAVPGIFWPGIPDPLTARVLAVQYQLRESQWWTPEQLLEHQLRQAGALIAHARKTVPFYREFLSSLAGRPFGYEEFRRIPILTRERLQEAGASIVTEALPAGHGPARGMETSGSTGRPVRAQETVVTRTMLKAINQRFARWHRLDHTGKLVSIRSHAAQPGPEPARNWGNGYASGPLVFLDVMTPVDELLERIVHEQPRYVAVYPTIAQALARRANELGVRPSRLECILSFGETLDSSVRADCERWLGARVLDAYSAIEAGVLALQCPGGEHYHVASESVLLEVLDDSDRPCAPGEVGRVVVTPLHNFATPLIRYEIGDYAQVGAPCACGRGLPVLNRIMGRTRNMLVLPTGERRWPFPAGAKLAKEGAVRQIQLVQTSLHEIDLRVVSVQPLTVEQRARLSEAVVREFGHPFRVRVIEAERIERAASGKYEDFVCELTGSEIPAKPARKSAAQPLPRDAPEPKHRLRIDERWSVWRDVVLRGAGFSVDILQQLSSAELARSADALLAAQDRLDHALSEAKKVCYQQISAAGATDVKGLRRVMKRLKKGRVPADAVTEPELRERLDAASALQSELESARLTYGEAWRREEGIPRQRLKQLAAESRFREAVAWQNRNALVNGIDPWLRGSLHDPAGADSQVREYLVARYLQRYAAKNDTIGFFGPVGWARISDIDVALRFVAGDSIAVQPVVQFEPWAMRALAHTMSADAHLRPWLSPTPHPAHRREGEDGIVLLERPLRLAQRERLVFERCDGTTAANAIAAQLAAERRELFPAETDVLETLDRLAAGKLIRWSLAIPLVASPDGYLRTALERLAPGAPTARFLEMMDSLTTLKERACQAYGDADAVSAAIARLEREFESVSGAAASHLPGQDYGGRTLVYLDTRRDASCELSETLALELGRSLRPVLDAASWVSRQFFAQLLDFVDGVYDECRQATRSNAVPLDTIWFEMQKRGHIVDAIREDVFEQLIERWSVVMPVRESERSVEVCSEELLPKLAEVFGDMEQGWPGARFQSPDVMLAADSIEAVGEGRYRLVLGELHPATRSLLQPLFIGMHAQPAHLLAAAASDQGEPELRIALGTERAIFRNGSNPDSPIDFEIECDESRAALPRERVIPSGALLVERRAEGLELRTRDGRHRFPAAAFVGTQVTTFMRNQFAPFAERAHTPRVTIDRLVIQRESWRVRLDSLEFAHRATRAERFLGARRWALSLGLPRLTFYRLPGGHKPVYLDLESQIYVDVFAKLVRTANASKAESISITEMLPRPDEVPLTGSGGQRYTSEFRMVFVNRT